MKGSISPWLVALVLTLASGQVLATTTLPPVVVHGITIDNVLFECRSAACADMLGGFGGVPASEPLPAMATIGSEGTVPLPKDLVCAVLRSMGPDDCSVSSPPTVPGYSASWRPNGCGTGGLANIILSEIMGGLYSDHYSGDLNAPLELADGTKVSFLSACNNHDRCWASGGTRGGCDGAFLSDMQDVCYNIGANDQASCLGMASTYHGAVASDRATGHYEDSLADFACAAWASDMNRNGCN